MKTKHIPFLLASLLFLSLQFTVSNCIAQTPQWAWAKSAGGGAHDEAQSIATDAFGNVIVVGFFRSFSINFDSFTLYNDTNDGSEDIFIAKYNSLGIIQWAKSIGGNRGDWANSVSTDILGNIFVAGSFLSGSISFGSFNLSNAGNGALFVAKFDYLGNIIWVKTGEGEAGANCLTVDIFGNCLVCGGFRNSIIFGSDTLINNSLNSSPDIFVAKFSSVGQFLWAKSGGGGGVDIVTGLAIDSSRNILLTGYFDSDSITFGTLSLNNVDGDDIFLAKFDSTGNTLWVKSAQGGPYDYGNSVTTDLSNNIFIVGSIVGNSILFDSLVIDNSGGFLAKYDLNGNILWAKSFSGEANSISTDPSSNVILTGYFGTDSIAFGSFILTNNGNEDIFLTKMDSSGNILWAKSAGGKGTDEATSTTIDASGNILICGWYGSDSITFDSVILENHFAVGFNMFVAKLDYSTAAIEEANSENSLLIYPNPGGGSAEFRYHLGGQTSYIMEIYDVLGGIVEKIKLDSNENIKKFSVNDYKPGIYFLRLGAWVGKMIVIR